MAVRASLRQPKQQYNSGLNPECYTMYGSDSGSDAVLKSVKLIYKDTPRPGSHPVL